MKVAIGSDNPVKIKAVEDAFKTIWPKKKFTFKGYKVPSGVSDQPMSPEECIKGAKNRARRVLKLSKANFGVGLEGGLEKLDGRWFDCGWIVVIDRKGGEGVGCSMKMETPPKMMKHIRKGLELGQVDDIFFKTKNSKQKEGHFGLMTKNSVVREEAYKHAVICALVPFIHPNLF
ncbi:MAG TPA: inosine/xanthosine triphosphatase [Patescibacteria group bacterium]|nr:inosine/xanthosine triphosphatase [Patescibacteria group bacterium]